MRKRIRLTIETRESVDEIHRLIEYVKLYGVITRYELDDICFFLKLIRGKA